MNEGGREDGGNRMEEGGGRKEGELIVEDGGRRVEEGGRSEDGNDEEERMIISC